jgi:hypothetical protein
MFEKLSRAAEKAAAGVGTSRRGFLGQLGRAALGAAAGVGGLLATAGTAAAAKNILYRCGYRCDGGGSYWFYSCGYCPQPTRGCKLSQQKVGNC